MLLRALRARKTSQLVMLVNACLISAVLFGVPITPEQMAGALGVVTALLAVVLGPARAGEDGDPETPL